MDGVKRAPVPFAPRAQTPEEALPLYEDAEHAETAYRTARFRTAYALHLGYWSFLFVFFAIQSSTISLLRFANYGLFFFCSA